MDDLQGVVAELAKQLGIGVGELWDWMQGTGFQAYASVKAAKAVTTGSIALVACVFFTVVTIRAVRRVREDFDDDFALMASIIAAACAIFAFAVMVSVVPSAIAWIVSPEGMLLEKVLG